MSDFKIEKRSGVTLIPNEVFDEMRDVSAEALLVTMAVYRYGDATVKELQHLTGLTWAQVNSGIEEALERGYIGGES